MKIKENNDNKDKSTQCITMKTFISDLKKEIDFFTCTKRKCYL